MATSPNLPSSTPNATPISTVATRPFTAAAMSTAKSPSRPQAPHSSSFPLYHLYASQNIPIRPQTQTQTKSQSLNSVSSTQQQQGILYPVASSGRGFIPRPVRPPDHTVTVANLPNLPSGAYNPCPVGVHRPAIASSSGVGTASPLSHHHLDSGFTHRSRPSYLHHPVHLIRKHPTPLQHQQKPSVIEQYVAGSLAPIKGIPFAGQLKASSSPLPVSDSNGYTNLRSRDDTLIVAMIRDRKVRILEDASLYALCRSWLRNGFPEEIQPHNRDGVQALPEPLPLSDVDIHSQKKKDDDEEEDKEDEEYVDNLSAQDLLRRHIKRAKKVRARLREGRLKRIARFKTRLAMLLPPQVEQFRNDTVIGN
ncbi:uncharacterized protein [Euphorbia lathyris]|uniref:uncharacterized protein n=1 Tax=Euphorbia lathyris TaxID=212925 RepID=UPI003313EDFC